MAQSTDSKREIELVTPAEASSRLRVSRRTLYSLLARGTLTRVRLPGVRKTLLDRLEVDRLLESATATREESGLSNTVSLPTRVLQAGRNYGHRKPRTSRRRASDRRG